ncbi:hypothetical protein [Ancylobacter sp. G4_0304]|uniref:hypothetical protein n=1 Tax=Ancylobacter sp. G4_0304 TaxID=3114289 RepID=UPI0039C6DCCA
MIFVRTLRLLLTLLALGFAMANPAAAVPAMASGAVDATAEAMPCHETAATPAKAAPATRSIAGGAHLCCVLACLVVPPLGEIALNHPAARASALAPAAMQVPSGRLVAMPTPPPRLS